MVPQTFMLIIIFILVTYFDIRYYRIPNFITIGFWVGWGIFLTILTRDFPLTFLFSSLMAFLSYFAIYYLSKKKMGMGDVKLALLLGGFGSLRNWYYVNIIATTSAVVIFSILYILKKATSHTRIPFGPFMCFGALLCHFFM